MRLRAAALLVASVVVLAAGCGSTPPSEPDQAAPAASPSPTRTSSPPGDSDTALPTLEPPTGPPKTPTDQGKPITVTGTVRQGVEAGCVVLVTGRTRASYLLLGSLVDRVDLGTKVTLRGLPVAGELMTTCQQGIPLQVHEILSS